MDYSNLLEKGNTHYKNKRPFVLFCLPDSTLVQGYFQETNQLYFSDKLTTPGFVMARFFNKESSPFIPRQASAFFSSTIQEKKLIEDQVITHELLKEKKNHVKLVEKAIAHIHASSMEKVVLSRRHMQPLSSFNLMILMERLFQLHKGAFRYVWFHPSTGLWCGATPEILIASNGNTFTSMALAGTKKYEENESPNWTPKEMHEQQIVTDVIVKKLQPITTIMKVLKRKNHRAGFLVHLRTDFEGVLNSSKNSLKQLIDILHPTPAVCGAPQRLATDFILENENYSREFYTGFLGVIENSSSSKLFVNLRCMQLTEEGAKLYVGGGVTANSVPENEWIETQNKLQTMLQVLAPFL